LGRCSGRCTLIFLCTFQLVTTQELQMFNLLGYQWAPILATFACIVVILGLFSTIQCRPSYIVVVIKLGANWQPSPCRQLFMVIFGVDFGGALEFRPHMLSLIIGGSMAGRTSGWPGSSGQTAILEYGHMEALHSTLQTLLVLMGFICACHVVSVTTKEEVSCKFDFIGGFDPFPLYHINEKPSNL
ncbi:Sodium/potassium-transporting ATPase subunit beta-1-interacting protein 4, partial [Bos mutus]